MLFFYFILSEAEPSATKSHLSEADGYTNSDGGQSTQICQNLLKIYASKFLTSHSLYYTKFFTLQIKIHHTKHTDFAKR